MAGRADLPLKRVPKNRTAELIVNGLLTNYVKKVSIFGIFC